MSAKSDVAHVGVLVTTEEPAAAHPSREITPSHNRNWFARAFIAIGAFALLGQLVAMFYAGIGWDGRMDAGQSVVIREVVPNLPEGTTLQEAYDRIHFTAEFYGILIPQIADILHFSITRDSTLLTMNELATYRWQGLANIMVFATAAIALGVAVGISLRSRLAGAYTWSLLMTTPLLFGMSYINIKDLPVAAGLTLVAAGLMVAWAGKRASSIWLLAGLFVVLGSAVGIASRPGFWPVFGFLTLATISLFTLLYWRSDQRGRLLPLVALSAISVPSTLLFLWWTNPFGRMALFTWLWDSFSVMRNYPWQGTIRTAGQDLVSTELPLWYAPAWLLAQLPIATTVLILAGIVVVAGGIFLRTWGVSRIDLVAYIPLFILALVLPVAVVVSGAVLYDGIRHLIFAVPALIALSSLVIARLDRSTGLTNLHGARIAGLVGLTVVLLSGWATMRWFPYSYAFINPIAGINSPERDWELDYWGVTSFEGIDRLQQAGLELVAVLPSEEPAANFGGGNLEIIQTISDDESYGLYVFHRWGSSIGDCQTLFTIERDRHILGEGATCQGER